MKKLILVLIIILMAVSVQAADITWSARTGEVTGYIVYFTDGTNMYNINVGNVTIVTDIDNSFNLSPNINYVFTVTAYNNIGESGHSNTAEYLLYIYEPPIDKLPEDIIFVETPLSLGVNP